jgi:hypothetical protein
MGHFLGRGCRRKTDNLKSLSKSQLLGFAHIVSDILFIANNTPGNKMAKVKRNPAMGPITGKMTAVDLPGNRVQKQIDRIIRHS